MGKGIFGRLLAIGAMAFAAPALAQGSGFEAQFDNTLGTELRVPQSQGTLYSSPLESRIAQLADDVVNSPEGQQLLLTSISQ